MEYSAQRNLALKERNDRVMRESLIYIRKKTRIKNFFTANIQVESLDGILDAKPINQAIKDIEASDIGKPKADDDLQYCQRISDELFLRLSNHFADSDIKITVAESSGSAVITHYRSTKPSLTIKI